MNSCSLFDDVFIPAHVSGSGGHWGALSKLCLNNEFLAFILHIFCYDSANVDDNIDPCGQYPACGLMVCVCIHRNKAVCS